MAWWCVVRAARRRRIRRSRKQGNFAWFSSGCSAASSCLMTRTNLTARRRFVLSGLLGVAGIAANVSLRGRSCAVARKRRTQQEDPLLPEQDPHWRYLWLKRSTLMSDEPVRELVASEARRVARLAIADQVAAMERFLDPR